MSNPDPELAFDLIDQYFRPVPDGLKGHYPSGRICWAPSLYLVETLTTLMIEYVRPGVETDVLLKLLPAHQNPTLFNHAPVHHPPIHADEEFVAVKAKRRPVIVLSQSHTEIQRGLRREGDFPPSYLCAPLYTPGDEKFHPEFIERVKAFEYHQFFYIPHVEELGIKESFVRFDRIQVIAKRNLERTEAMLTQSALDVFNDWLEYHLTGNLDPTIAEYRELRLRAIRPTPEGHAK